MGLDYSSKQGYGNSESESESYSEEGAVVPPGRNPRLREVTFKKNKSNKKNTNPDPGSLTI
ncbi:hypothetical protein DCAR_0205365 [Daucus carota subsp. sativus]|uniref:Uncharacterized protein n=1 Tax=Daucus carota subsp. sativus TaxID=79200 RepID=A0A166CKD7_DAUCS|nr:hypothetical protein DCAR_0205365 [Daucus carota subsp. sativus]